jgi:hypothetical protein
LTVLILIGVFLFAKYEYDHTFSTARWIKHPNKRIDMVQNLLSSHDLIGESKEQILRLLDEPRNEFETHSKDNFSYFLGSNKAFGLDVNYLFITFADDIVASVRIVNQD